jgi:hypothetical protein
MFCAPELIFGGTEGVGSCFHFLRARTCSRRYRGRRVPFKYFTFLDSFSTVTSASGPFFLFCAPGLILGGTECIVSRFHVLRSRTHFRRYRGRHVPFSCFARPDTLSAVPRASGPVFMFCAPGLVFDGTEGVGSRFHVFRSRTRFRRCRVPRVPFSYSPRPDSFSAVPKESGPVFMFCAPGLVFDGTEGVGSRFHVFRSRTRFRRCRVPRVPFSYFLRPDSFSAVLKALGPVFMFSAVPRASGPVFPFCVAVLIFGGIEGVGSRFNVLCSWTRFRRYRGRRVSFSCFALPNSFSAVPGASGIVFMFCTPGLVFGGTEGVGSSFHVLRARTRFLRY